MPIEPLEPWTSLKKSKAEGPIGFFCAWPVAHCSSSVPGPAEQPVRKTVPDPITTSMQRSGSERSHCARGTSVGVRSRYAATTDLPLRRARTEPDFREGNVQLVEGHAGLDQRHAVPPIRSHYRLHVRHVGDHVAF